MKKKFLQTILKESLIKKLVMTIFICMGICSISGVVSHISISQAAKPKKQAAKQKKEKKKSHKSEKKKKSEADATQEKESDSVTMQSSSDEYIDDVSTNSSVKVRLEDGSEVAFNDFIAMLSEEILDDDEKNSFGDDKEEALGLEIYNVDGDSLPRVSVINGEEKYQINPKIDATDLYVENLFVANRDKSHWDCFNSFFERVSTFEDIDSLKKFFDRIPEVDGDDFIRAYIGMNTVIKTCEKCDVVNPKNGKKRRRCKTEDSEANSRMEVFKLAVEITKIVDTFAYAVKDVLNDSVECRREVFLTCQKLRKMAEKYPKIMDIKKVNEAIEKIIMLKSEAQKSEKNLNLDLLKRDYECKDLPKKIRIYDCIDWKEKFTQLDELNQLYMAVYNTFLETKKLIDQREYFLATLKMQEVKNIESSFETKYQECVIFMGLVRYKDLIDRFDKIYFALNQELIFDRYIENITRNIVVFFKQPAVMERDDLFELIDKYLAKLNEFYPLGTTYFTDLTFKDVCEAIDMLEKLKLARIEEEELKMIEEKRKKQEEESAKIAEEELSQQEEKVKIAEEERREQEEKVKVTEEEKRQQEEKAKMVEKEQRKREEKVKIAEEEEKQQEVGDERSKEERKSRKVSNKSIGEKRRQQEKCFEKQRQAREQKREKIKIIEQSNREKENQEFLSRTPIIYDVTYVNDQQRRSAEKFLLENPQYKGNWTNWYEHACRGSFTTNLLPRVSSAPFYKDFTKQINPQEGRVYEAEVRTDGKKQGLRVVFYKDKFSDKVVIIYVGLPFGEQHGNVMSTIEIREATFDVAEKEYEKFSKKSK